MPDGSFWLCEAQKLSDWTKEKYRTLHMHPETCNEEFETHRILRAALKECGIPFEAPKDNITVATVDSGRSGQCLGIRCDTDGLPVTEETGLPYASVNPGKMHACGHDGHMALGLTAARLLSEHKPAWHGRAKIIFQPAEEMGDGALQVIRTGLVNDCDGFFAIHLWSPYRSGYLCASPIAVSAAVNEFRIDIRGQGGHGATPEKCKDALLCACAVTQNLQSVVARNISPMKPALLSVCSIQAGTATNIIAGHAVLQGTLRSLDEETRVLLEEGLSRVAQETAAAYGCTAEVRNARGSGAVINDPALAALAHECALEIVPAEMAGEQKSMMLGDDFSEYGAIAPYVYCQAGIADSQKGTDAPHHAPTFRIDEDVLPAASAWCACFAERFNQNLRKGSIKNPVDPQAAGMA